MYQSYTSIYHAIPSYDGISRYMSGYQGVRIPDDCHIHWMIVDYTNHYRVLYKFTCILHVLLIEMIDHRIENHEKQVKHYMLYYMTHYMDITCQITLFYMY
jgi:hypothetical protein